MVTYRDPVTKKTYSGSNMADIIKEVNRDRAVITSKDIQRAKSYYAVSSKVVEITDRLGKTAELFQTMQEIKPKTIEQAAVAEYSFAKQEIAKVTPLLKTEVKKPMALSLLADVARGALRAVQSPTGQAAITGALGAVTGAPLRLPRVLAGKVQYTVVRDKGRLIDTATGRTIGYTPQEAKKRFKTKRRRKRLTQKDKYEWEMRLAIANVQAGKPAMAPIG